jgi:hypothetical protein
VSNNSSSTGAMCHELRIMGMRQRDIQMTEGHLDPSQTAVFDYTRYCTKECKVTCVHFPKSDTMATMWLQAQCRKRDGRRAVGEQMMWLEGCALEDAAVEKERSEGGHHFAADVAEGNIVRGAIKTVVNQAAIENRPPGTQHRCNGRGVRTRVARLHGIPYYH